MRLQSELDKMSSSTQNLFCNLEIGHFLFNNLENTYLIYLIQTAEASYQLLLIFSSLGYFVIKTEWGTGFCSPPSLRLSGIYITNDQVQDPYGGEDYSDQ